MSDPSARGGGVRPHFDPHDPRHVEVGVPFDVLAEIRATEPVYRTPSGSWYLSRHADVEGALRDVDTFRAELGPITGIPRGVESIPDDQLFLSEITEPRHGRIRRLFNACFATHRVRDVAPVVAESCHRLVDELLAAEAPDLHAGYAMPIPAMTMAHVMGLGDEAVDAFIEWSFDGTLMTRPATPGVGPDGPASHRWFARLLAEQRRLDQPSSHVVAVLLGAEIDGRALTDREILTQLHFMIQAGVHTTRGLLTHAVHRLVHEPDRFAALATDPHLVPVYVEESLRHDAPVQRTTRLCTRDTEVGGVAVAAGEWVEMGIASANRDEAVHDDPEHFRLDRDDPRRHLSFGAGSHICPGATLARLEAVTAVQVLLERVATMTPVEGHRYPPIPGSLGHQPIPVRLRAR